MFVVSCGLYVVSEKGKYCYFLIISSQQQTTDH